MKDTYKTLSGPSEEILFKDRKSKFYGYAYPIKEEAEVKPLIDALRKQHHTANHVCYAWKLGTNPSKYRANDDGEPNNSAGMPIYGQIQAFDLTDVLVAVPRIFGGTKLGVGGLIQAYKMAAQLALENSKIITKKETDFIHIRFNYDMMTKVQRLINQHELEIDSQEMQADCKFSLAVAKSKHGQITKLFEELYGVNLLKG